MIPIFCFPLNLGGLMRSQNHVIISFPIREKSVLTAVIHTSQNIMKTLGLFDMSLVSYWSGGSEITTDHLIKICILISPRKQS